MGLWILLRIWILIGCIITLKFIVDIFTMIVIAIDISLQTGQIVNPFEYIIDRLRGYVDETV